jgi:hypothetical protein
MKINKYKILALLGVGFISALTITPALNNVQAALTAPASYNVNYRYSSTAGYHTIGGSSLSNSVSQVPSYTRTTSGIYYNYTTTLVHSPDFDYFETNEFVNIPDGISISMTFNRSNTSWEESYGLYFSDEFDKIGSDVSASFSRFTFSIDNQTSKNYLFTLDSSSSPAAVTSIHTVNSINITGPDTRLLVSSLRSFYITAYSTWSLSQTVINTAYFFNAWYLQDLGVSASYDAGLDAGEDIGYDFGFDAGFDSISAPDTLLNGFQAMVGILVNFMLMILNLEVFGVSIMSVFAILALFVGVIWILKIVRG